MTKYPEIQNKFEKVLESHYIHKINDNDWDFDGYNIVDTVNELWSFIEQSLSEREKRVREEIYDEILNGMENPYKNDTNSFLTGGQWIGFEMFRAKLLNQINYPTKNESKDDLKNLGLKPRKINFKKIEKLANRINKAMEKEEK